MSRRALRREVERLKCDVGWQEAIQAEVKAAERRQRERLRVIEYELLYHRLVPIMNRNGQNVSNITADYDRARAWLDEEDTAEQWQADHEQLVAHEIEKYGEERDVARRDGWGPNRSDMIEHYIASWERLMPAERHTEEARMKEYDLWREAPDGRGVLTESTWQEKH